MIIQVATRIPFCFHIYPAWGMFQLPWLLTIHSNSPTMACAHITPVIIHRLYMYMNCVPFTRKIIRSLDFVPAFTIHQQTHHIGSHGHAALSTTAHAPLYCVSNIHQQPDMQLNYTAPWKCTFQSSKHVLLLHAVLNTILNYCGILYNLVEWCHE